MLPTHDVHCPECDKFVYTALTLEDSFPADGPASPKVESDARGDFVRCPHCGRRISMLRVTTDSGVSFRRRPEQAA
jgi:DNA-directed RNA polymerase subunit RPC12/RpoP